MKTTIISLMMLCATLILQAQEKPRFSREEFDKKQQEFITKKAELTPKEAEKFFPLFFELQQEKWKINHNARKKIIREKGQKLTPQESRLLVFELADAKIEIAQKEKLYLDKFLEILSAEKILQIQRAEERFQHEIIKDITNRKQGKKK